MGATVFASSADQFAGEGRKLITLSACDGSSEQATMEWQLRKLGLIKKWRHEDDDRPGTVFYWFKHVAAQAYEPSMFSYLGKNNGSICGVCGKKDIQKVYSFRLTGSGIVNLTDTMDILLPEIMKSGSICIHLADEFRSLTEYLIKNHLVLNGDVHFRMGRIVARDIIDAWHSWDKSTDVVALPVQWFYFTPMERKLLMLGQSVSGYGYHVYNANSSKYVLMRMAAARKAKRTISAYRLFDGTDEYGHRCDIATPAQTAIKHVYVILTRKSACGLSAELFRKEPRNA